MIYLRTSCEHRITYYVIVWYWYVMVMVYISAKKNHRPHGLTFHQCFIHKSTNLPSSLPGQAAVDQLDGFHHTEFQLLALRPKLG